MAMPFVTGKKKCLSGPALVTATNGDGHIEKVKCAQPYRWMEDQSKPVRRPIHLVPEILRPGNRSDKKKDHSIEWSQNVI